MLRPKTEGQPYTRCQAHEVQCVKERVHQEMDANHKHKQKEEELDHWSKEAEHWETNSDYDSGDKGQNINQAENEVCRVTGEGASTPLFGQQHKERGQDPQVMGEDATEAPSFLLEKSDFKKRAEVEQQVIEITRKRLVELSPIKVGKLPEA